MGLFSKKAADTAAAYDAGREKHHADMDDFHAREAVKYDAKAVEREAKGDVKGAARARKVADRNRRLSAKHAAQ